MKVIGAGFGRTGTLSLKIALEKLGFDPCYHMIEVIENPTHSAFWERAADDRELGKPVDWDEVLSDYEATVDWPGCAFYSELADAYPDAKVLLSVRDPERWYASARSTIGRGWEDSSKEESFPLKLIRLVFPSARPNLSMIRKVILWRSFGKRSMNESLSREEAIEAFERHNEEVKRHIPDERLLVYEVKQGWQPLCEFLDVPVPDEPFPHVNEREAFPRLMWRGVWASVRSRLTPALVRALAGAATLFGVIWLLRRMFLRQVRPGAVGELMRGGEFRFVIAYDGVYEESLTLVIDASVLVRFEWFLRQRDSGEYNQL